MKMFVANKRQKVCHQTNNNVFCTNHFNMSRLCLFFDGFKLANLANYNLHSGRHNPVISVNI
jgi:hypothetical protein